MVKTHYSFTTDSERRGAPTGHSVPVREMRLSAGAGFVVVICGEIMTRPGLPRAPSAKTIRLNAAGEVEGLFQEDFANAKSLERDERAAQPRAVPLPHH